MGDTMEIPYNEKTKHIYEGYVNIALKVIARLEAEGRLEEFYKKCKEVQR